MKQNGSKEGTQTPRDSRKILLGEADDKKGGRESIKLRKVSICGDEVWQNQIQGR